MKRADMVRAGAHQLVSAEDAVERAFCETAELASSLGRMRMDAKISMVIGQDAMNALMEAMTAMTTARAAMVRAHGHLDEVKTDIGCRTVAMGTGLSKKKGSTSELSIVGFESDNDRSAA
jgi:hypothetical protein